NARGGEHAPPPPPPALGVFAESRRPLARCGTAEPRRGLVERRNGPCAHVLAVEQLQPFGERTPPEDRLQLGVGVARPRHQIGTLEQLTEAPPEVRLERCDRYVAAVRRLVDPIARERSGQRPREARKLMGFVRHRDDDSRPPAGSLALEEG